MARLSPDKAKVLRDRIWNEIDATLLIPGDIIKIKLGDIIRADVRLLKGGPVKIYKGPLTGVSFSRDTYKEDFFASGSICTQGEIDAVVIATGSRTKFGEHTHPVDTTNQDDQYQKDFTAILQFCMCVAVVAMLIETVVMYPHSTTCLSYGN
ncbi:ATPase 4, plasma membrane-type-like [Papaver somniferum]|uniref:ATPase 4, plasma membrane-type-like n=1 Tax=Papaver somniferum TaxID=3469 RepID=UPI000E6FE5D6|nr:ATPase 4, plasma membrane-type-like [Papaver somniferum]XP_026436104.1 ATPase 4, plasma membrane-type-like [Papaver somniferum]